MPSGNLAYSSMPTADTKLLRIVLVDDHETLREGLKSLLETDRGLSVVGEAGTAAEAMTTIKALKPSVVITDLKLPDQSGVDLILGLRARNNTMPILVLTVNKSAESLRDAMRAGSRLLNDVAQRGQIKPLV